MGRLEEPAPHFTLKRFDPETGVCIWTDDRNRIWYRDKDGNSFADALVEEVYAQLCSMGCPLIGEKNG